MLLYQIAITLLPDIGDLSGKKLIAYCGGAEAVFKENKKALEKIPGISKRMLRSIAQQNVFAKAESEIEFLQKHQIKPLFYLNKDYPDRLRHCDDGPIMLYYKGTDALNAQRIVSIVGTRKISPYGQMLCEELIDYLAAYDVTVVSGLAYGADTCAHQSALRNQLNTIGVLGHGLDRIYPAQNRKLARDMLQQGGLLTEYRSGTLPDAPHFPARNRIVAGVADATVVIESGRKGGSLITADLAFHYNRDVMAFPGDINRNTSEGCNQLIRQNKALLITSATDLVNEMNWDRKNTKEVQRYAFHDLDDEEKRFVKILEAQSDSGIDTLSVVAERSMTSTSSTLLNLELKGVIMCLPGKRYKLV